MTDNFKKYTRSELLTATRIRKYETKLGEVVHCFGNHDQTLEEALGQSKATYVVIGIPEDAGIRANYGIAGAATLWPSFLTSFLNLQSNRYLNGDAIFFAGAFDFSKELNLVNATAPDNEERIKALNILVEKIDNAVEEKIKIICRSGKIPILIGGGHNNAYGAIKGAAKGLYALEAIPLAQISVINLDAHTDYRMQEGRHSGNAFRYADNDGYLNRYFVIGPHENYLQEYIIKDMVSSPFLDFISFEDIFIKEKKNFMQAVAHATGFVEDNYTGIELDLDAITNVLTSAMTPSGITALMARKFLHFVATDCKIAYLHICEGAIRLADGAMDNNTGKLVSYLLSDFVKSHSEANQNGLIK